MKHTESLGTRLYVRVYMSLSIFRMYVHYRGKGSIIPAAVGAPNLTGYSGRLLHNDQLTCSVKGVSRGWGWGCLRWPSPVPPGPKRMTGKLPIIATCG